MDLFTVETGSYFLPSKPRVASPNEVHAYLLWLADQRGVAIPGNAIYCATGIYQRTPANTLGDMLLEMPRASSVVTCEILDDAGAVVRTMPLPVDAKGKLPMTAKQAQEWTGLDPVKVRKPRRVRAQAVTAPPAAVVVEDAPAPVLEPVAAPEPVEALAPIARPAWVYEESCHFAAGHNAASQGKPRALPSYFTTHHGQNARDWLRGFDLATAEAAAVAETPVDVAPEGDADAIAALDGEKAARLARASAAAVEALEADGVTDPLSAGCDYIWPRFVTTYLGLQHQRDWHFEGTGKQRDRKARNHGAVMISPAMYATIRAHFEALAPFQPAAVVEPVALLAPSPESAAAAPVADDIGATVAALAARVAALEGAAAGKRVRSDREARAIVRAWRMRMQVRAARADAAQARASEAATRGQLQAQACEAMRLEETVEQLRSDVTDAEVRAHRFEQEADGLRTALAAAQSDLAGARADMDSLAPLADVLASFAQRRVAAPALPSGAAG